MVGSGRRLAEPVTSTDRGSIMASRFLTLLLVVLLALPGAAATPTRAGVRGSTVTTRAESPSQQVEDEAAAEAKKKRKKGKKNGNRPRFTTVTRTVRQPLTRTFANTDIINAPVGATSEVKANPYPSVINVAGFANGSILDVDVTLNGFTWDDPGLPTNADTLLAASQMPLANAIMLSNVCGANAVTDLDLTLDDEAATGLPDNNCVAGTYKPTNIGDMDTFPEDAPEPSGNVELDVFDGGNPNGTWQLFVVDDVGANDPGSISGGWSLRITAEVDVQIQEQIQLPDKKNKKKGGKKRKGRR
jgi:hypothetical protein